MSKSVGESIGSDPDALVRALDRAVQHHGAGRLSEAEAIYRSVLEIDPDQPSALHLLGVMNHQTGEHDAAVALISKALTFEPDYAEAHNNLGNALKALGRLDNAIESYGRAIALKPADAMAHYNLANALQDRGRLAEAVDAYRKSLAIAPNYAEAHNNLGNALKGLGHAAEAAESYRKALTIRPDFAEARRNLAAELHGQGRLEDAINHYRKAVEVDPTDIKTLNGLGAALAQRGRFEEAVASFRAATSADPNDAETHNNLGHTLRLWRQPENAVTSFRKAIALKPDYAEAHNNLGNALKDLGRIDEAAASYEDAFAIRPDYAKAHYSLGTLYENTSRLDDAEAQFRKALSVDPDLASAHISLAVLMRRRGEIREAIAYLEGLSTETLSGRDAFRFHFELGKLWDLEDQSERAFKHFATGNRIQAENAPANVDRDRALSEVTRAGQIFTPELLGALAEDSGEAAPDSPIFLIGFPRSGTTLLDQILDSHPRLQVMEEKPALAGVQSTIGAMPSGYPAAMASLSDTDIQNLRSAYWRNVAQHIDRNQDAILVDKLPLNLRRVPLIARLFPAAPIVFALRHPCDVVLSCFMQSFELNDAMANLFTIEDAARFYQRVMGFWLRCADALPLHYHTVRYEHLVLEFEAEVRRLFAFLEIEWDDATLDYRTHARERGRIRTPSYQQVTQPIYQTAKYRWTRYEAYLQPVLPELQPYIDAFGYAEPDLKSGS